LRPEVITTADNNASHGAAAAAAAAAGAGAGAGAAGAAASALSPGTLRGAHGSGSKAASLAHKKLLQGPDSVRIASMLDREIQGAPPPFHAPTVLASPWLRSLTPPAPAPLSTCVADMEAKRLAHSPSKQALAAAMLTGENPHTYSSPTLRSDVGTKLMRTMSVGTGAKSLLGPASTRYASRPLDAFIKAQLRPSPVFSGP